MAVFPKLKEKAPKMAHHDRSHYFRTSMAPGLLYPILCRNVVAGDDIQLDYESLVNTQALLSPLYGSYKLQIDTFFGGTSLYVPKLWRNGSMQQADGTLDANYPTFTCPAPASSATKPVCVDPSSLAAYLGFAPGFGRWWKDASNPAAVTFNGIPLLMYYDIVRHYYVNRQESSFAFMSGSFTSSGVPVVQRSALSELDNAYLNIPMNGGDIKGFFPSVLTTTAINGWDKPLSGLACRCYMPDRMNVILNKDFYAKNVTTVQVSTVGDSFQIDQLVTAKKLWNSRNKDAMTSGTFKDWVRVHFGVTPKIMDDMPTFLGSTSSDIMFEDIRATTSAQVGEAEQYLGDKASSGKGYLRSRRHRVVADRPGYLMVIASLVPRVDYYQNQERYTRYLKLSDEFRPEFNGIGLQDVLVSDLNVDFSAMTSISPSYVGIEDPFVNSVGKQPAWIEYMTAINKIRGTFCTTEKSWVLARDMRSMVANVGPVLNTTSSAYVVPSKYNQPFAIQDATAQNFLVQFHIKEHVRTEVLKRLRPRF